MSNTYKFKLGEVVVWRGSWGTEAPKEVKVIGRGVKDNELVYDLANGHWAYENQLSLREATVIPFPAK